MAVPTLFSATETKDQFITDIQNMSGMERDVFLQKLFDQMDEKELRAMIPKFNSAQAFTNVMKVRGLLPS